MRSRFHTFAAWLVLVAYLLSGVAPGRGLVVCLEADGSAALELASSGCDGCPDSSRRADDLDPRSDELSSCACLDVPLPLGVGELRAQPKCGERGAVALCQQHFANGLPQMIGAHSCALRFDSSCADRRPAPGLAHLRTVVLRV